MLLTRENIGPYLLEQGWVDRSAAVNGDLAITAQPTRNNVFRATQARGQSCFLKQPYTFDESSVFLINREARVYRLLAEHEAYRSLAAATPRLIAHDAERHVLAVEYLTGTTNVHEVILRHRDFFPELATRLGEILASFHFVVPGELDWSVFPRQPPWLLQMPALPPTTFFPHHAAIVGLLQTIQSHTELSAQILQLRDEWSRESLIHGDIKWVNFIVAVNDHRTVRLIDWEMADVGDPAWDVAGLFQSYLCAWTYGFDEGAPSSYRLPAAMIDFDPSRMHPSVRMFWAAYVDRRQLSAGPARQLLHKSVRLMACRMIQTVVEATVRTTAVSANGMRTIQVAANILRQPEAAARDLLGLESAPT